jgi:EmrB/QacA subfamily drug resistance transporter
MPHGLGRAAGHGKAGHGKAGHAIALSLLDQRERRARAGREAGASQEGRQPWTALVVLCAAQFMVILDMTVTTIALPSIGRSLGFAPADLQWVVTSYLLATGGLTLLGGRAADLFGGRRTFTTGLALFTVASLASGFAPSAAALLTARAAQGTGAALLTPSALALLTATYAGPRRTAALSAWGALAGSGLAAGVLLGGVLTSWLGWRSVFLINVPVGLAALAAARHVLTAQSGHSGHALAAGSRLDLRGAVLVVAGLVALDYGISRSGWGTGRIAGLAAAAALLTAFAVSQARAERGGGPSPLVPLGIFRLRPLTLGGLALLSATGIQVGVVLLSSLFLQGVLGASAVRAGVEFLPPVVLTGLGAGLAAHLLRTAGSRVLAVCGFALMAGGALWLSRAGVGSSYWGGLLPGLLLLGAGSGMAFPAAQVTGLSTVGAEVTGLASGLLTTGHEIGAAIGAALFPALAAGVAGFTAGGAGFALGYRHSLLAAGMTALALAALAAVALPNAKPSPGIRVGIH